MKDAFLSGREDVSKATDELRIERIENAVATVTEVVQKYLLRSRTEKAALKQGLVSELRAVAKSAAEPDFDDAASAAAMREQHRLKGQSILLNGIRVAPRSKKKNARIL